MARDPERPRDTGGDRPRSERPAGPSAGGLAPALDGRLDPTGLHPGLVLAGKYRLLRPAGFGAMGTIWVARNEATDAEVAVKLLLEETSGPKDVAVRFRREAHAAAQLYHRGIVRVFDLVELRGDDDGSLVMVMELLRGETLGQRLDRRGKLPLDEATSIALAVLSALAHAHGAGVIHRDIKPDNIFLCTDPDGHVTPKLLDFGISKIDSPSTPRITSDGAVIGTPSYMSPEQARGARDIDARTDVFSTAIVLYEMLEGNNPFAGDGFHATVAAILERTPAPMKTVPPDVAAIIQRALSKNPADRPRDASEFAVSLRDATRGRVPYTSSAVFLQEAPSGQELPPLSTSNRPPRAGDAAAPPGPGRREARSYASLETMTEAFPDAPAAYPGARRSRRPGIVLAAASLVGSALALSAVGLFAFVGSATRAAALDGPVPEPVHARAMAVPGESAPAFVPAAPSTSTANTAVTTAPSADASLAVAPLASRGSAPAASNPPSPAPFGRKRRAIVRDPGF